MSSSLMTLGLLASSSICLILMLTFNALSGSGSGGDLFIASVSDQSDRYQTLITPAGWAFTIWTLIFLWLALGQLFFVITFFLHKNGDKTIHAHNVASNSFLAITTLNYIMNTCWVFIADRSFKDNKLVAVASFFLFAIAATNILAAGIMARNIAILQKSVNKSFAYGIIYRIILNGFVIYTTWTVIASLINLAQAIGYVPNSGPIPINQEEVLNTLDRCKQAAYASLSLLFIFHVTYFVIENVFFDSICRWILTPYIVVIWASAAVYAEKKGIIPKGIEHFVLAILIIAVITFVVRIVLVAFRTFRK